MEEDNAEAHYLYGANLGSSAQIKGVTASALRVKTLKIQMHRALELSLDHAPSLHRMGMILEEFPWFLGGDAEMTITCLVPFREVKLDYTRARLDLAKIYIKRQNHSAVGDELLKILNEQSPSPAQESWQPDQQKAEKLLDSLTIHHYSRLSAIATHPLHE